MSPRDAGREGPYAFHLDNERSYGFVKSVSGGSPRTNIAVRSGLRTYSLRKRPVSRSYENFYVEAGMGAPLSLFQWVSATLENGLVTRSGEVHSCDTEGKSKGVNQFFDAHIREITFPRLDASSTEAAFLSISIHPSGVRLQMGTGEKISAKSPAQERRINRSSFRVEMGNFQSQRIRQVEEIKWSLALTEDDAASDRFPEADPIEWTDVSNIKLVLPVTDAQDWLDWFYNVQSGGQQDYEVDGSVEWLSADYSVSLARIDLLGCGPVAIDMFGAESNQDAVAFIGVELYANSLRFKIN